MVDSGRWKNGFAKEQASKMESGRPIPELPVEFTYHAGPWRDIFDLQIDRVKRDVRRACAQDSLVVYLSCPISSRGGGYQGTNVDIAMSVERYLMQKWGEGIWILNPARYQLESKSGTGLMEENAQQLGIDIDQLKAFSTPGAGDYMRMWTKVLAENNGMAGRRTTSPALGNSGQYFDAFYFVGPSDVHAFFERPGETLTSSIGEYFSRKFATDPDFRDYYSTKGIDWHRLQKGEALDAAQLSLRSNWELSRKDFFRYYALRASVNFSLGSHDEWNIFVLLNAARRLASVDAGNQMASGDPGDQIAAFFDGIQVAPSSSQIKVSGGYSD